MEDVQIVLDEPATRLFIADLAVKRLASALILDQMVEQDMWTHHHRAASLNEDGECRGETIRRCLSVLTARSC
jgi:hypothetical protein